MLSRPCDPLSPRCMLLIDSVPNSGSYLCGNMSSITPRTLCHGTYPCEGRLLVTYLNLCFVSIEPFVMYTVEILRYDVEFVYNGCGMRPLASKVWAVVRRHSI